MPTLATPESVSGRDGGNPDLGPVEAATSTIGVVWTPRLSNELLSNLQLSLDWYRIDIADKIDFVFFDDFGQWCYDRRYNPDLSAASQWCRMFSRDPATGQVEDILELQRNAFDWTTSGIDMQVDWRFDLGPGQLGVGWLVSWLDSFRVKVEGSVGVPDEFGGTIGAVVGGSLPEWKSNLHLSYAWRDLTVGASWRYIDSMIDANADLNPAFRIPHIAYFDLSASYEFSAGLLDNLQFGVGVENVTDEDPPIFPSFVQANTDPSQYDAFGRRYYASLRYSF